jgi:hypothetical protein
MVRWFRLYDDIIDDPKIIALSPQNRWHYVAVLSCANRQSIRGTLPPMGELAIHLRVTPSEAKRIISRFIEDHLIDVSGDTQTLSVHGWHKRQFKSDDVNSRVATFRDSYKKQPSNVSGNVTSTLHETPSDTDTDTDTEKKNPPKPPKGGKSDFVLPSWIDLETWNDWLQVRTKKKAVNTDRALRMAVTELERLKGLGYDPKAVLEQSIFRGWPGLYEIHSHKPIGNGAPSVPISPEKEAAELAELERYKKTLHARDDERTKRLLPYITGESDERRSKSESKS